MKETKSNNNAGHVSHNSIPRELSCSHEIDLNVAVSSLLDLPGYRIYWKDLNGKFVGCNHVVANDWGLASSKNICGLSEYDLPVSKQDANACRENDKFVLQQNTTLEFTETCMHSVEKKKIYYKSIKMPLHDQDKKPIGILGVTTILHKEDLHLPELSARQKDCLYCLVQGMTVKETSQELKLSPKTVEHYIDAIRVKLNCGNRSSLVKKAFEFAFIREKINLESWK